MWCWREYITAYAVESRTQTMLPLPGSLWRLFLSQVGEGSLAAAMTAAEKRSSKRRTLSIGIEWHQIRRSLLGIGASFVINLEGS